MSKQVPDRREDFPEAAEQFLEPALQPSLLGGSRAQLLTHHITWPLEKPGWLGVGEKGEAGEFPLQTSWYREASGGTFNKIVYLL